MTVLADNNQRIRALTDLETTLLVEAAAGTGKTSLLAGRVVGLLASGIPPREIAAITFTEFAAGELRKRITGYLDAMASGRVPKELQIAYPDGPTEAQRDALIAARKRFDELTCSTIHGFCHTILRTFAVEAAIDPGADILDSGQADLAFRTIFDRWLRDRLDRLEANDAIARTAKHDPIRAEQLLRDFAEFRRRHRTARPLPANIAPGDDAPFGEAVAEFRRWFNSAGGPPGAEQDISDLEQLAAHFSGKFDPLPGFDELWSLVHPEPVEIMRKQKLDLKKYQRLGVWRHAKGSAEGSRLNEEARTQYEACATAFRGLVGKIATVILASFAAELNDLMENFVAFKRNAAVLDFDDLLNMARDVLRRDARVREAAAKRFTRVLIDEFQDTDPIQAEIAFTLAALGELAARWYEQPLRPGQLFMVGDPKQAIYRFRGADIATYRLARNAVERQFPGNVIQVASNFRSCADILKHINHCFETPLQGQAAGYVALEATRRDADHGLPCVSKARVEVMQDSHVNDIREVEAEAVADICGRLIGNIRVRRDGGEAHILSAGDIALLAPIGAELWRYERALEEAGLPFSSQAGKNFYRRQEVQDLVALVRALADPRDTIALGALLRGPLLGLTEQELLDLAEPLAIHADSGRSPPWLSIYTDPALISHGMVRQTLSILRDLRLRVRTTEPALLLTEAVERLNIRAVLMTRSADQASRMLANVDALLEKARAYGSRGFRQFARDLDDEWSRRLSHEEGVVDADEHAIKIVTIHSSKGLEWPVVIPINTASGMHPPEQFVYRREADTMHWVLDDVVPPGLADVIQTESREESEQRLRLLYVACTRAMDLLVLPEYSSPREGSWAREIDFKLARVPELDIGHLVKKDFPKTADPPNNQTRVKFEAEQAEIDRSFPHVRWVRPSAGDPDVVSFEVSPVTAWERTDADIVRVGGAVRGVVLHKLMEELITGELSPNADAVRARSRRLCQDLATDLDSEEVATVALRTWGLPELGEHRSGLVAEVPIYGILDGDADRLVSGRADAVAYGSGKPSVVFDWKSDMNPDAAARSAYASQIAQYVKVLGASRGAVVYMSLGHIQWVSPTAAR
jgi:CRISPR-associated exonuclease Cas4